MVHGPGNKGNLNLFYKFIKKGLPYPLGAFENKRSFLSVENFCFVTSKLLQDDIQSGVYNLADDEPLSTNQLFKVISRALGKKPNVWNISASAIKLIARMGDTFKLPVNTEHLNKLTENYVVSNNKIKKAIGIVAMPVSAAEGISTTILSFEGNNN
jgi:nucleoside-diphosphate-sugar epimerase